MREPQRLSMEKDLAVARRAMHRVIATAESGAYFEIEESAHAINDQLALLMESVMNNRERVRNAMLGQQRLI